MPCFTICSCFFLSFFSRRSCLVSAWLSDAFFIVQHHLALSQLNDTVAQQRRLLKVKTPGGGFHLRFQLFDKSGDVFLGGFSVGLGEYITATYACTAGNIGFGTDASGYSHSVVIDVALTDKLNYVLQTDYIDYEGVVTSSLVDQPGTAVLTRRYGVNQYWFYQINECLDAGLRVEWFNVEEGPGADRSDLYELTFGLNYRPHPNLCVRPEIRWDKDDDAFTVNPDRNDRVGFGMDMILTF